MKIGNKTRQTPWILAVNLERNPMVLWVFFLVFWKLNIYTESVYTSACSWFLFCSRLGPHNKIFLHLQVFFQRVCGCSGIRSREPETAHKVLGDLRLLSWSLKPRTRIALAFWAGCRLPLKPGSSHVDLIHVCQTGTWPPSWEGCCFLKGNEQRCSGTLSGVQTSLVASQLSYKHTDTSAGSKTERSPSG